MCYDHKFKHKGITVVISNCFGVGFDYDDPELAKSIKDNDGRVQEVLEWIANGGAALANEAYSFETEYINCRSNSYLLSYLSRIGKEEIKKLQSNPYLSEYASKIIDTYLDGSLHKSVKQAKEDEQRKKIKKTVPGYVYLLKSGEYYKIGKAKNLKNRLDSLAVGVKTPFDIKLIHSFKSNDYTADELSLHNKFSDKRSDGEWFVLSSEDVSWICSIKGTP